MLAGRTAHSFRGRSDCGRVAFSYAPIDILDPRTASGRFLFGWSVGRGAVFAIFRITGMNRYICDADDFYVNVHLNTEMDLPSGRDTVLHFFEQMKKGFPELRNFYTRENGDLVFEGDKDQEMYRWLAIEPRRLC